MLSLTGREAPLIEIYPSNVQTVTMGGSAILQCRVLAGIPQPNIVWIGPTGQRLSSNIEQLSNGVLRYFPP